MRTRRHGQRGLTLVEVLVSLGILSMIAILMYGTFDSISRGKKGENARGERARQGRSAVNRIARDVQSAFISMHNPQNLALLTRTTAFVGKTSTPYDRLDFTSFAHRRTTAESQESDQAEIGYSVAADPDKEGKFDLVRREQSPGDTDPQRGGVVNVLCENVESFDIRYLDPATGMWVETWDTVQASAQPNRLPLEVRILLVLKDVPVGVDSTYATKVMIPMQQPLSFGIPR